MAKRKEKVSDETGVEGEVGATEEVTEGELEEGAEVTDETGGETDETGGEIVVAHQEELNELMSLKTKIEESYWSLSELLKRCYDESWYLELGYETWTDFVANGLDFSEKKAKQLIAIQNWFGELKDKDREFIQGMGWTKVRLLVGKVTAAEFKNWRAKLKGKSYRQIEELFSSLPKTSLKSKDPADEKVTKTLKLPRDIAESFDRAIQQSKDITGTDKVDRALDAICVEYMTAVVGVQNKEDLLRRLERGSNLEIIAFDKDSRALIFGAESLQRYLDDLNIGSEEDEGLVDELGGGDSDDSALVDE